MNVISVLLFTLLLLVSVDLKKKRNKKKKLKSDSDPLRVYVTQRYHTPYATEPHDDHDSNEGWGDHGKDSRDSAENKKERGERMKLLDLHGTMREKFIYAVTTTDERVSVVCSPFSAMMPLGILSFGAGNKKTEKELLKSFGVHKKSEVHDYFKDLRKQIKRLPEVTTHLASRIYINNKQRIRSSFKEEAEETFGSCIEGIDMKDQANTAREVNKWVRYHTNEKISEIIKPSDVSPYTVVMVVDAFYFAGYWEYKFDRSYSEPFYGANGQHTIQLMKTRQQYVYGTSKVLGAEAILIPYRGGKASMLVLLPHRRDGLSSLLRQLKLAPELINKIKMKDTLVELHLPKFKIETSLDLKVLYEKVGLKEMFTDGTGFDKMVKDITVKIDKGIHKAMIEVNELGTIASASSLTQGYGAAQPMDHVVFRADHPFLFFIIAHKQQLFGGIFVG